MSLHSGDLISTATPPGVGHGQMPPVSLRAGNELRLGVEVGRAAPACGGVSRVASLSTPIVDALISIVGSNAVLTRAEDVVPYSFDGTAALYERPSAVVFPQTTEQVVRCIQLAGTHGTPIVTRGSGTGLSGGSVPTPGCMVLCLTQMDAILAVDPRNLTLRAQPGAITQRIDDAAARHGLFYPPDPGSIRISTIGGNVAENSGGLRGLKYGVTRDYVMGLEVVLADGRIARLGNGCVKDVAGYSLKDLFIGSEGTLGVITEVLLKLVPRPAARRTLLALYDRIEDAAETVSAIVAARIIPCTLEFLDRVTAGCVEEYARVGLPTDCAAVLLMETDGHPAAVADKASQMESIARAHRARDSGPRATRRKPFSSPGRDGMRLQRWPDGGRPPSSRTSPCHGASWRRW